MFKKLNQKWMCLVTFLIIGNFLGFPAGARGVKPKAGDVIDSSNIEQYKDYFPMFMQRYIKDGWGFEKPVSIKLKTPESISLTKVYLEASKENMKTCKLTSEGLIEGYNGMGMPFLEPKEPNKALKIMWNQFYKLYPDSWLISESYLSIIKRKGSKTVSIGYSTFDQLMFSNRTMREPIPELNNPKQLYYANKLRSQTPPLKYMATLTWRYKDPLKFDDMWTYVPTLRRTLRLVTAERANPVQGSPYAWDDIFGFDGKIPHFTYKMLGEQTVIVSNNQKLIGKNVDPKNYPFHPVIHHNEEFETLDCWVIDIKSKNPRYPQSRKTVWVDKTRFWVWYAQMYDKQGNFWKAFWNASNTRPLPTTHGNEEYKIQGGSGITDFRSLLWVVTVTGKLEFNVGINAENFLPGALSTF
jgi:hypothetical protein